VSNEVLIAGLHAVQAVLARGRVRTLWVAKERHDQRIEQLLHQAAAAGLNPKRVPAAELEKRLPGVRSQGVVAACEPSQALGEGDLDELLGGLQQPPFLLVLDEVQDPHNLGACLRSADGAGVHAVITPQRRSASLNATVRKVASGAAETVPLVQVTNLARTLKQLGNVWGIWRVGAADEADSSLYQAELSGPLALVLGSEAKGLRRLSRENCDSLISIPMAGAISSLNVSVAAGVCLYEAVRQRS